MNYNLIVLALSMFVLCAVNVKLLINTIITYIKNRDNMQILKQQVTRLKEKAGEITDSIERNEELKKAEEAEEYWESTLKSTKVTFVVSIIVGIVASLSTLICGIHYVIELIKGVS